MSTGRFFGLGPPLSEDFTGVLTSSRRYLWRRHLGSKDGGAGNDINQDLGRVFRSPLWRWRKMVALPLPAAILDDLICGTRNEVIQDGGWKRKGRHFPPPPQWGSKNAPYTTALWGLNWYIIHGTPCRLVRFNESQRKHGLPRFIWHIDTARKQPPFGRRHSHIDINSECAQIIACHWPWNRPLPKIVVSQFTYYHCMWWHMRRSAIHGSQVHYHGIDSILHW